MRQAIAMDWQIIFNAISDPAMILDLNHRILEANEKTSAITGISSTEITGRLCHELFHGQPAPPTGCPFKTLLTTKKPQSYAIAIETLDKVYMVSISPLFDAAGKIEKVLHIARDITEQRQAETALQESEKRFRVLIEQLPAIIYTAEINSNSTTTYISPQVYDILGFTPKECLKNPDLWEQQLHPDDRNRVLLEVANSHKSGEPFFSQYRMLNKSGREVWFKDRAIIVKGDAGKPSHLQGLMLDRTQQILADQKAAQSERKFRAMMEAMSDPVYICSAEYRVEYMNPAIIKMVGRDATGEFCYKALYDFEKPCPWCEKGDALNGHKFETEITNPKDQRTYLVTSSLLQNDDNSVSNMIVFRDTTEKERLAKELLKIRKLESIGVLAGGIAHDFNNILAAILGNLSLALELSESGDEIYELLKESEKASLRAKTLTLQLLTFATGGDPIKKITSIEEVLRDSAIFALRDKKIRCNFSFAEKLKTVAIDNGQISQVIQNLLINASQAMPNGGLVIIEGRNCDGHINPYTGQSKDYIEIKVKDQGIGIPRELLEQIFDPYFTTKQQGSGLGLAIAHSIIAKHDGHIKVDSEPGQGTEFSIYLPVCKESSATADAVAEPTLKRIPKRIMIMDDEKMIRTLVVRILSRKGYEVVEATDGSEAIKLYQEAGKSNKPIDLVIMDLTIPGGMGGADTIGKILELDPQARAMISSGYANDPVMANYQKYGFMAALSKPFQIRELVATMDEVFNQ